MTRGVRFPSTSLSAVLTHSLRLRPVAQQGQPDGQLYLARQVEVQPVFNREFIAQLSDGSSRSITLPRPPVLTLSSSTVASANLLSLEQLVGTDSHQRPTSAALADGTSIDGTTRPSAPHLPTLFDRADRAEALEDLETALVSAVKSGDTAVIGEVLALLVPGEGAAGKGGKNVSGEPKSPVARILWRAALEEKGEETVDGQEKAEGAAIPQGLLDFSFVDDINGRTALHEVRRGPFPPNLLFEEVITDFKHSSPCTQSASAGRLPLVLACLEKGLSLAQADVYGRQPLHYAAMNGHSLVCRTLLAAGASPSTPDLDGYSPIIYSITHGWTTVVETFLSAGVSCDGIAPGTAGSTTQSDDLNALSLACQYGHEAIARLLLERGAKVIPNPAGYYPQHLAAREGHSGVLRLLVTHYEQSNDEPGIDVPDKYSQATPLSHAASEGHAESVEVLLAAGSDVHSVDEFKRTPIHYAAWQGHVECVNLLIDHGATRPGGMEIEQTVAEETAQASASVSTLGVDPLEGAFSLFSSVPSRARPLKQRIPQTASTPRIFPPFPSRLPSFPSASMAITTSRTSTSSTLPSATPTRLALPSPPLFVSSTSRVTRTQRPSNSS